MPLLTEQESFQNVLAAAGRSPEIAGSDDLYGWLVGSWDLEVLRYGVDLAGQGIRGEAHFGWVLEGRAVQDVWIMPVRSERSADLGKQRNMFGTTLRVWDAAIQGWRITWLNPVTGQRDELTGRRIGKDIVQVGARPDGTPIRWNFTEIAADSFRWTGERLDSDGETWVLEGEFRARRIV